MDFSTQKTKEMNEVSKQSILLSAAIKYAVFSNVPTKKQNRKNAKKKR